MPRIAPAIALLLIAPAALLSIGCQTSATSPRANQVVSDVTVDKPVEGRPTLAMPVDLPNSDVRLVPFTVDRQRGWFEDSDRFRAGDSSATIHKSKRIGVAMAYEPVAHIGISRSVRWHNAVFQPKAGQGWLALDERGMISRFEIIGKPSSDATKRLIPKAILITATVEDTNGDGVLTSQDADVLLCGDKDGRGLKKITPPGTKVWDKLYNREKNLLLIRIAHDSNGDGKFTIEDSAQPYIYEPGTEGIAKPLVDPELAERAEHLLK